LKNNTIAGMLSKIKWTTPPEKLREYSVIIRDRKKAGGYSEIMLSDNVQILRDRLIVGEKIIPIHRVVEIRKGGKSIWRRNA